MTELWCVIEFGSNGEIFQPDFFTSKEEAVAFIEEETKECLYHMMDLPGADRMTDIVDEEPIGKVWTDKYNWFWHGFDVTNKIEKLKENENV